MKPSKVKLMSYSGHQIDVVGASQLDVLLQGKKHALTFQIVNGGVAPLIGLSASEAMGLVVRTDGVEEKSVFTDYTDVFEGTGELKIKHSIQLKEGALPVVSGTRQTPHAMKDKLKEELERLERENIIVKVEEPTEWVNPIVCVVKPNKQLRICLDPKKLNEAIMREHYMLPLASDIFARISSAKVFST